MALKILLVEDHLMIADAYIEILSNSSYISCANIIRCLDLQTAYDAIVGCDPSEAFDLVFLDYSVPVYQEKNMNNGLDLGVFIREQMPDAKIIMITGFADSIKLNDVIKKISPNGFAIKTDMEKGVLEELVDAVLGGKTYYSPQVYKSIGHPLLLQGVLDSIDQKIIVLLSQGLQITSIASLISMSIDTIKKRKAKIKEALSMPQANDELILKKCRDEGLIPNFF